MLIYCKSIYQTYISFEVDEHAYICVACWYSQCGPEFLTHMGQHTSKATRAYIAHEQ